MTSSLSLIISREVLQRITRKSFIITTILMPVLMLALMVAPALIVSFSTPTEKQVAVIDRSGVIATTLQDRPSVHFIEFPANTITDSLLADDTFYGILEIGKDIVSNPADLSFKVHEAASIELETSMASRISETIENIRLAELGYDNIRDVLNEVEANVVIVSERIGEEKSASSMLAYGLGVGMTFILYMFLLIYGQMVMTSIIEEKNNRVLEIVVSSVNPTTLMLGKILGIGLVATIQVLIWALLLCSASTFLVPWLTANLLAGSTDLGMLNMFSMLGDLGFVASLFGYLLLFLIGGFLFYSSIFAAIGSSVDNIQDAGQLQSVVVIPIVLGLVMAMSVIQDPNSSLALWLSIIPFTSPMVMLARIPFGIPGWEIGVSVVLLYLSTLFMVWLAAKIYRVGIFMYGKKPTVKELIRWARYK